MARLFFALCPNEAERLRIAAALPEDLSAGRLIPPANFHVTLAFLGELGAQQADAAQTVVDGVASDAFRLRLTELQYWERSRTLVLVPDAVPEAATALQGHLARGLREEGLPFDARAWRPHLTVARRASPGGSPLTHAVTIHCREFVLMESQTLPEGAVYKVRVRRSLPSPADDG